MGTEIEIYVNDILHAKIHTSCSEPIGPDLIVGDFEVIEGQSRNGGPLCPVEDCGECDGKVNWLTLKYNGETASQTVVTQKKVHDVIFDQFLAPDTIFSFGGMEKHGTMSDEINIFLDGSLHTTIHTSCSQPVGPGLISGDFMIIEGQSRKGGMLCTIGPVIPTVMINANPMVILQGDSSWLTWHSSDAQSVSLDNGIGDVSLNGSLEVSPAETAAYTVTATGLGGVAADSVTIQVIPLPEVELTANPSSVIFGESVTLTWHSAHADSVILNNGIGAVSLDGSMIVSPSETVTYTVTAAGPGGTVTATAAVTVNFIPTVSLTIHPQNILKGQSATLSWTSAHADSAWIDNSLGPVDVNGSLTVSPEKTTAYTIYVTGDLGATAHAGTVCHVSSPPVARLGGPYNVRKGTSIRFDGSRSYDPDGDIITYSWDFGDASLAGTGAGVSHTYTSGGIYQVTLTVDDGKGGSDTAVTAVRVTDTDLELANIDLSDMSVDSQSLKITGTVSVDVVNNGITPTQKSYEVILFEDMDGDGVYSASGDKVIGVTAVSEEHAGGVSLALPISVNSSVFFSGSRIFAFADSGNVIGETDENNNITHNMAGCGGCADLTASHIRSDPSDYPNSVNIIARIGNGGALHVSPGIDVSFYDGDPGAGGILLGTAATSRRLNPGEYEDVTFTLDNPQQENFTIYAAADDDGTGAGKINETDEDNNITFREINIGNHDPVITSEAVTDFEPGREASPPEVMDLSTWEHIQYVCGGGPANWVFSNNYTTVHQTSNSDATILLSDIVLQDSIIHGVLRVGSSWDDDYIGFVFGYQDRGHYYLFDWKKATQGTCKRGMRVHIPMSLDSNCANLCNPDAEILDSDYDISWQPNTNYEFTLEFHPGEFIITIMQGDVTLKTFTIYDDTYLTGKFGFFNHSQDNAMYTGFTRETLPSEMYIYNVKTHDPDDDILTYSLTDSPDGMTVDSATGVITWTPADDQTGIHHVSVKVSDGKGGTDIQHYTLKVISPIDAYPVIIGNPVAGSELAFAVSDPTGLDCEWDFGDSGTAAGCEAVHAYAASGDYDAVLHVTDSNGKSADIPRTLHINPPGSPAAAISVSGFMTAGQIISFDGSESYAQSGAIQAYEWNFGDGHTGAGSAISHIYADAGNYQAGLTVTDTGGLSSTASVSLTISPGRGPVAGFGYSGVMADGNLISFDASGSYDPEGQGLSYVWDFGDGVSGAGVTPNHAFSAPGDYAVTLTVTDSQGQTGSASETLAIGSSSGPAAQFSISGRSVGEPAAFDGSLSSGDIVSYSWNFGDGSTGAGAQTEHTYTDTGKYSVILRVTDSSGAWSEAHGVITVTDEPNQNPGVRMTCPLQGILDEAVSFSAAGSDPDGDALAYSWNFGDNGTANGATAGHVYTAVGIYDVTVTVTDGRGGLAALASQIEIIELPSNNVPPAAEAGGPYQGDIDRNMTFDGSGAYDLNRDTLTYTWDFGDGETGEGVSPSHIFDTAGVYVITLTVSDPHGLEDTDTAEARVSDPNDTVPPAATLDITDCIVAFDLYTLTGSVSDENGMTYTR